MTGSLRPSTSSMRRYAVTDKDSFRGYWPSLVPRFSHRQSSSWRSNCLFDEYAVGEKRSEEIAALFSDLPMVKSNFLLRISAGDFVLFLQCIQSRFKNVIVLIPASVLGGTNTRLFVKLLDTWISPFTKSMSSHAGGAYLARPHPRMNGKQ